MEVEEDQLIIPNMKPFKILNSLYEGKRLNHIIVSEPENLIILSGINGIKVYNLTSLFESKQI